MIREASRWTSIERQERASMEMRGTMEGGQNADQEAIQRDPWIWRNEYITFVKYFLKYLLFELRWVL